MTREDRKPHTRHREKPDHPHGLVLSRKVGERILIGNDIIITVTSIANGQVKLVFNAPPGVSIDREEVRISKETQGLHH